jgi:ubiquitin-protein ligase E3 A
VRDDNNDLSRSRQVCGGPALNLFQPEELELLICGNPTLDFEALERVTHYEDGYDVSSPLIRNFWSVVHELEEGGFPADGSSRVWPMPDLRGAMRCADEKKKFLKFVSGSDRAPINGLASMTFVISKNGDDSDRLPTAHTCFNHLLLPNYATRDKLKNRLKLAITQSEGFGLR